MGAMSHYGPLLWATVMGTAMGDMGHCYGCYGPLWAIAMGAMGHYYGCYGPLWTTAKYGHYGPV